MENEINSNPIKEVELFLKRLHDMEIVSKPQNEGHIKIIGELTQFMLRYQNAEEHSKNTHAIVCLSWINLAFLDGILQKGEGFTTITKRYEDEINQLKKQLDECEERCKNLEEQNRLLNILKDKSGLQGDVSP
ncbi:MAG: hypothetical protein V1850_01630 [Candidatus Bathyarchaeota archaeon]